MCPILELEFSGELVLGLFVFLPLLDVLLLDVLNFCLHRLQLGKQLQDTRSRKKVSLTKKHKQISVLNLTARSVFCT